MEREGANNTGTSSWSTLFVNAIYMNLAHSQHTTDLLALYPPSNCIYRQYFVALLQLSLGY